MTVAYGALRSAAIDRVKGLAILAVFAIHAEVLIGSWVHRHLINHAVPVFVVVFGLNAEHWWRRRGEPSAMQWWIDRARRLYPPLWATLACWWTMTLVASPWWLDTRPILVGLNVAGVLPNIGTGWFVTLLLQLVALQPFLRRLAERSGPVVLLAFGLGCLVVAVLVRPLLVDWLGVRGARMFAPRLLGHVAFGMLLARWLPALDLRAGLLAALAVLGCAVVQERWTPHPVAAIAERVHDLPLTVCLLVVSRSFGRWPALGRPLAWLGVQSYGLYLGQLLVHDGVSLMLGLRGGAIRLGPWSYAAVLVCGAVALLHAGRALAAVGAKAVRRRSGYPRFANPDAGR